MVNKTGDFYYFDGRNYKILSLGADGNVLTVYLGKPVWRSSLPDLSSREPSLPSVNNNTGKFLRVASDGSKEWAVPESTLETLLKLGDPFMVRSYLNIIGVSQF